MNILDSIKASIFTPIHPAGIPFIAIFFILTVIIGWLWSPLYFVGIVLTVWCIYFFRNPSRVTPVLSGSNKNNLIISPADGRVIEISKINPTEEIGLPEGNWTRVCVFMNVFDVHVNRSPMLGQITYKNYIPGSFFNASLDKASSENERLILGMDTENGKKIAFVQIAGLVARRIICDVDIGSVLKSGVQKIGKKLNNLGNCWGKASKFCSPLFLTWTGHLAPLGGSRGLQWLPHKSYVRNLHGASLMWY